MKSYFPSLFRVLSCVRGTTATINRELSLKLRVSSCPLTPNHAGNIYNKISLSCQVEQHRQLQLMKNWFRCAEGVIKLC